MEQDSDNGLLTVIVAIGFLIGIGILIGRFTHEDSIYSKKRINPDLRIIYKNNRVDTTFIYHKP